MSAAQTIDSNATDRASEGDRLWFEDNQHRQYRVRPTLPGEVPYDLAGDTGWQWTLVKQVQPGIRLRMFYVSTTVPLDTDATGERLARWIVGGRRRG